MKFLSLSDRLIVYNILKKSFQFTIMINVGFTRFLEIHISFVSCLGHCLRGNHCWSSNCETDGWKYCNATSDAQSC